MLTLSDRLLERFRTWELRGRGWDLFAEPVELEPATPPFPGYGIEPGQFSDTGRRQTWLSGLATRFGRSRPAEPALADAAPDEFAPSAWAAPLPGQITELEVLLPERFALAREAAEQMLAAFRFAGEPVSFEIIGGDEAVACQLALRAGDEADAVAALQTFAPAAAIIRRSGSLAGRLFAARGQLLVADLGLSEQFIRPLKTLRALPVDPLAGLVAALAQVRHHEFAAFQILFAPARDPWAESVTRAVVTDDGKPFFGVGPEGVRLAQGKIAKPLYAVRARLAVRARGEDRRIELLRASMGALGQFSQASSNELIALDTGGWAADAQVSDLLFRSAHRTGMILNAEELAGLAHLPGPEVTHPQFARHTKRTKELPPQVRGSGVRFGVNIHNGQSQEVRLPDEVRLRHTYVIGGTGTGKSTLLLNLILADIEAGRGVAVLDPHGDLVDAISARIPETRTRDVILLDPADEEFPVGLNILTAHSDIEKTLLSSDLVAVFRRLSTAWGDQMHAVLANALLAFLESAQGGTLLDLRRFLVEKEFRAKFLNTVSDPEVVYFWQKEFPQLIGRAAAPLLTRLDTFLRPRIIRNIVAQRRSLDFRQLIDSGQILLAKLAQGAIGEENAYLLGTLLVAKLHQVALSRADTDERRRADFHLYVDEFQHFVTPSMSSLLSGVRKYRLGLTLAHQHLGQLGRGGDELVAAVLANAATRICFRLGDADARSLAQGFAAFEAGDLQNLGVGEAICRVERSEHDFNLQTARVPELDTELAGRRRQAVREASRAQFATPKGELPEFITPSPAAAVETAVTVSPAVAPPAPAAAPAPTPMPVPDPVLPPRPAATTGRGGREHRYLQTLIKGLAEERGFKAELEVPVLSGTGNVDVVLRSGEVSVACEISVTSTTGHEVGNLQKCLAAGFAWVVLVSPQKRNLTRVRKRATEVFLPDELNRLHFCLAEELPELLDQIRIPPPVEKTVRGYKVKVQFAAPAEETAQLRTEAVRDVLRKSLRKTRETLT